MTKHNLSAQPAREWTGKRRRSPLLGIGISVASLAALVALAVMMSASNPQVTTIRLASALDDRFEPVTPTETFHPGDTFFASVKIAGYRSDQDIKARWRFEKDRIGETVLETHGTAGDITAGFSLSNTQPWPAGRYTVEIVYGDKVLGSASFSVEQ